MVKKLVIHSAFRYKDPKTKTFQRAYRGDTIDVGKEDAERGTRLGAFGTIEDLQPRGLDEGVVELEQQGPTTTPVVPHISQGDRVEAVLRERLHLDPGATEADVVAALDAAIDKAAAKEETPAQPSTTPKAEPVIVNLPPPGDGGTIPDHQPSTDTIPAVLSDGGELVDEGQADGAESESDADAAAPAVRLERPPLAATKDRWEAFAVQEGEDPGQAKAMSKKDLQVKYGGE
jgi:hypothetical protein